MQVPRLLRPAVVLVSVMVLAPVAGCSSSDADPAAGTSRPASGLTTNGQVACEKYYAFELFRIQEVEDIRTASQTRRAEVLSDYRDLAASMVASVESAVTVNDLPARARTNADRILRQLTRSAPGRSVRDLSAARKERIARSAARIEALCVARLHPVPDAVLDAREESGAGT